MVYRLNVDFWKPDNTHGYMKGDVLDGINEVDLARLIRCGAAVDVETTAVVDPVDVARGAALESEAAEHVDAPVSESEGLKPPKKSQGEQAWRDYADKLGIDVKGLSKQEIIAATTR